MKVTTFGKAGIGLATAVSLSLGLGVSAAFATGSPLTASQEDPSATQIGPSTLVGAGSDTIQDVEYGISKDLGTYDGTHLNLASWTATGTTPMSYRSGGTPATPTAHPNGSGAGFSVLKESYGITPLSGTDGVAIGDVDYSRASGFQGNEQTAQSGYVTTAGPGVVTEIPFAVDAISFAAPAGSPFLLTNGGQGLKLSDLANIYSGADKYIDASDGTLLPTSTPLVTGDPVVPIQAFLPKPGSGSRQFFLQQLNKVNSAIPYGSDKGDSDFSSAGAPAEGASAAPYVGAEMPNGDPVQEHDASILTSVGSNVAAIAPFSAAKFIGYHNGVIADPDTGKVAGTDYVLVPFDSAQTNTTTNAVEGKVLPYTGTGTAPYVPNPDYKTYGLEGKASVTREVFNIIPTAAVANPTQTPKYAALVKTFVGKTSLFCADTTAIQNYGFLLDSNCGNTARTANAGGTDTSTGYSSATVTTTPTNSVAGGSASVKVSVQSNGNGGGAVSLVAGGTTYTGSIPAGQTSVSISIPTPTAGTVNYGGGASVFTPNLAGVAAAPITAGTITVAPKPVATVHKARPVIKVTAPRASHKAVAKVKVTVTAAGKKATGKVTIVIKKGKKKVTRTVTLKGGSAVARLGKLPKGKYIVYVSYTGSKTVAAKGSTRVATLTVK